MATSSEYRSHLHLEISEFWSGDLGLTLVTISLVVLVFIITPLREAALPGRFLFDLIIVSLMIFGILATEQSRLAKFSVIAFVLITGAFLWIARFHPTPTLQQLGSALSTITLLIYVRIVLVVMFRAGPVSWSRIQGGVSAYLLVGMAWASAFQLLEEIRPGSFRFVAAPLDFDQLISKLTYYSFCTLTTLGGDVMPLSPIARSLTIAESVIGQLFPAILIGALVAMAMRSPSNS
jgi:Ion channel